MYPHPKVYPLRTSEYDLVVLIQLLSCVQLFEIPWTGACQASLSLTISWSSSNFTSIESVIPSNHLILCCPLLLLPSIFPSIKVFFNELAPSIRWPKYWCFSIRPSNELFRVDFLRIDWFDLLAVQGTLKSLFQHHNSKTSIQHSDLFMVHLSHLYMTTGKTIALTICTFVSRVMSLLFNMLSRFVIAFLPRSKCLHFVAAGTFHSDFGAQKKKVYPCFYLKASGVGSPPSGHCTRSGEKQNSVPRNLAQSGSRCWPLSPGLSVLPFGASVADHWDT